MSKIFCRTCLDESNSMKDLFAVCSPEVFKFCVSIEISDSDPYPKYLCKVCSDLLNSFYCFKQLAMRSNSVLSQHHNEKIEIKPSRVAIETKNEEKPALNHAINDDKNVHMIFREKNKMQKSWPKQINKTCLLQCVKCERGFSKYEDLKTHMTNHFENKPDIDCKQCGKLFVNLSRLDSHLKTHSKRSFQCVTCGKIFRYPNVLKAHELIHTGVKNHTCNLCDAKFIQRCNLKKHLETHTKVKKFKCPKCDKNFAQFSNLKAHLARHIGVKSITCTLCDMKFYTQSDLLKHSKKHSEEKPYKCSSCGNTFKSMIYLREHIRSHTGERPFSCDICCATFMTRKVLKQHRMRHTGEKPYKCQLCGHAFIQKMAFNRHMKSHCNIQTEVA